MTKNTKHIFIETERSFQDSFQKEPTFIIRSPGRVNLLGEHTDYNGLPVLPMAIDRCIVIAGRTRDDQTMHVISSHHQNESITFDLCPSIPKHPQGHWANYVKAGVQGIISNICSDDQIKDLSGCDIFLSGDIPLASGLSSSSALVVASALALLDANQISIDPRVLAEWMAEAEWFVGTRGGGMDQAACLLGRSDHLLKIDFFPLKVTPVPWHPDYTVVICDSGVQAKKTEGALQAYNLRSAECQLAKQLINNHLKQAGQNITINRLGDLLHPSHSYTYDDLNELIQHALQDSYSLEEIISILSNEKAVLDILNDCSIPTDANQEFHCGKRYRHIVTDGWRVEQSQTYLSNQDMHSFAECMRLGHQSARDDFEISCPQLDQLVELALQNGAIGARLTGAGFGGSTVNIVHNKKIDSFISKMQSTYYLDQPVTNQESILITKPSNCAKRVK